MSILGRSTSIWAPEKTAWFAGEVICAGGSNVVLHREIEQTGLARSATILGRIAEIVDTDMVAPLARVATEQTGVAHGVMMLEVPREYP